MADRIPLIVNPTASQIQEVPAGDVVNFDNRVVLTNTTASTNKTSGAVVITGGVGISGALNVGGDITAFATSDKNLKENLVPIPNALNKVGIITGYTYRWKTEGTDYAGVHGAEDTGIVAQDVEALGLPGITTTRENGIKAVSYKRLIPILIEAIKELKKENDDLKTLIKNSSSFQNLRSSL